MKARSMNKKLSYQDKTVLITGHTGFKGYWLCKMLKYLGANVFGLSDRFIFEDNKNLIEDTGCVNYLIDILDKESLTQAVLDIKPDYIFHLAAQSLVRTSYKEPELTWMTNLVGTLNLINAASKLEAAPALICATTDKVYKNDGLELRLFVEDEALGGDDPYSASKAACEILIQSTVFGQKQNLFPLGRLTSVRAGNVVGGADWSEDRLIPDIIRSSTSNQLLRIRNPNAVRPWQHVLDCCYAYLLIGEYSGPHHTFNVGPSDKDFLTVERILEFSKDYFDLEVRFEPDGSKPEKMLLQLDVSRLNQETGFEARIKGRKIFDLTFEWYGNYLQVGECIADRQIQAYFAE